MLDTPLVSVVIPVYRVEPYLCRCVDSVLAQTLQDIEIILVDDGSPDGCPAICDRYAEQYPQIRVIHKTNGGVSSARNAGLNMAQGRYVVFCDSDDEMDVDFLAQAVADAEKYALDLWIGTTIGLIDGKEHGRNEPWGQLMADTDILTENQLLSVFHAAVCVSGKLWRRTLIGNHRFDSTIHFGEDLRFSLSLMRKKARMLAVPQIVYYYHLQPTGLTATVNENKCNGMVHTYQFLYEQARDRGYAEGGEFDRFLGERWCGDLSRTQRAILNSQSSVAEKKKLLTILLSDPFLYRVAKKRGFLYVHPHLREIADYGSVAMEMLRNDGIGRLWERVCRFVRKRH